jgi:hypothetical protein
VGHRLQDSRSLQALASGSCRGGALGGGRAHVSSRARDCLAD